MSRRPFSLPEFVRFLIAGGLAALTNIVARLLLNEVMPFEVATIIAYLLGIGVAYLTMRHGVFAPSGRKTHDELGRVLIVNLVGIAQVLAISDLLYRLVFPYVGFDWHAATVAHCIGIMSTASNYFLHKHFAFKASSV